MRVVFTDDIPDDTCGFTVGFVPLVAVLVHRIEDATVHRFQSVSDIGQRTRNDYAHRVFDVAALHFIDDGDRFDIRRKTVRRGVVILIGQGRTHFIVIALSFIADSRSRAKFSALFRDGFLLIISASYKAYTQAQKMIFMQPLEVMPNPL